MSNIKENIKLIALEEPHSIHAEIYRSIRTNIEYSAVDKEMKVINITSSVADEAKTTTAANLAIIGANKHKKVLVIDLDLRNPSLHRAFQVKNINGITDMLIDFMKSGEAININSYLQLIKHPNILNELYLLPVGTSVVNPTEILSSKKIKQLLTLLKEQFDEIIIDSSPSGVIADGSITSTIADGTIFVVESRKTKIDMAQKTIEQLKNLKVHIIGAILTKVPIKTKEYGYNYGAHDENASRQIKIDVD